MENLNNGVVAESVSEVVANRVTSELPQAPSIPEQTPSTVPETKETLLQRLAEMKAKKEAGLKEAEAKAKEQAELEALRKEVAALEAEEKAGWVLPPAPVKKGSTRERRLTGKVNGGFLNHRPLTLLAGVDYLLIEHSREGKLTPAKLWNLLGEWAEKHGVRYVSGTTKDNYLGDLVAAGILAPYTGKQGILTLTPLAWQLFGSL